MLQLLTRLLSSLIRYCKTTRDVLVPSVWGPVDKKEDPYAPGGGGCNCLVM
jgi:guanine nucleotide-binding protein subunit gamma